MTTPSPLLIASCPGRSINAVRSEIVRAAESGADLAEVRLDRLAQAERSELGLLFPSPIPLVATLRSQAEGGDGPTGGDERLPLLKTAAELPFQFLDLERARDDSLLEGAHLRARGAPVVIVSSHLPEDTPVEKIRRLLELSRPPAGIAKVVLPCGFGRMWSELLPGLSPVDTLQPYIVHTTGPTGPLLRAWAHRLGMFAVYASLPAPSGGVDSGGVEPTQIPVDRLRAFHRGGAEAPLFAVVGHPIDHSRSPDIHSLWMSREQRSGLYLALDLPTAQDLAESMTPFGSGGFRGLNVTHPWKQFALSLASQAGPAAEAATSANTLSFEAGAISAENTDVAAVRRRLSEFREAGTWDGSPAVVLGSGGAARSALAALASLGGTAIVVARRGEIAETLAREYGGVVGRATALKPARLVIHATPAGRSASPQLDLPWSEAVDSSTHFLDFVYGAVYPFLRQGVEARGATYEDGSRLLVYQAAESYALWWGAAPSMELQHAAMKEVLRAA